MCEQALAPGCFVNVSTVSIVPSTSSEDCKDLFSLPSHKYPLVVCGDCAVYVAPSLPFALREYHHGSVSHAFQQTVCKQALYPYI